MKTSVKEFHEDCVNACCQCPQCDPDLIPDITEFETPLAVLEYWQSEETYGGQILMGYDYWEELSDNSKAIFQKVKRGIEKVLKQAFG